MRICTTCLAHIKDFVRHLVHGEARSAQTGTAPISTQCDFRFRSQLVGKRQTQKGSLNGLAHSLHCPLALPFVSLMFLFSPLFLPSFIPVFLVRVPSICSPSHRCLVALPLLNAFNHSREDLQRLPTQSRVGSPRTDSGPIPTQWRRRIRIFLQRF